jgi:hypothetical protein
MSAKSALMAAAASVFLLVASYDVGYKAGANATKATQIKVNLSAAANDAKKQGDWVKADQSSTSQAESNQEVIRVVYKTITNTVTKYVKDNASSISGCGLDSDGLRLWNAANAGADDAAAPGGVPSASGALP